MRTAPRQISLEEWDDRYARLKQSGLDEPSYGGPLRRHVCDGDFRLLKLKFDNSPEAHDLWNFLLTEEDRLHSARQAGKKIIGTMKDLGTVPVMVYSLKSAVAFYPDGAWWIPCIMELSAGLLDVADSLGIDESFCPVRAMLGAFVTGGHFPIPDHLISSVGAVCDDFSVIAQRLDHMGFPVEWWEMPHRRGAEPDEEAVILPGGKKAPASQVGFVRQQLESIRKSLTRVCREELDDNKLSRGIAAANQIRRLIEDLRSLVFTAPTNPMPALEMLIAEMLAIHFCSDRDETLNVLEGLLRRVRSRIKAGTGFGDGETARIFWVNPVADLTAMNLLEECGGRICGTEYLFTHALDEIPEDMPPLEALARAALSDPMAGSAADRAERIHADIVRFRAEALIISRIPGASHCAIEGGVIAENIRESLDIPVLEIEVPPVCESVQARLKTRIDALVEAVKERRKT